MERTDSIFALGVVILSALVAAPACSSSSSASATCTNGLRDGNETGIDCGGSCPLGCDAQGTAPPPEDAGDPDAGACCAPPPRPDDGLKNGEETDVDCGGPNAPHCAIDKSCLADRDCDVACGYTKKCIEVASCKPHLGGDTCGKGEVGEAGAVHESCCRSLPVPGFTDPAHPGKAVYLDKYEITAGRVRAFIESIGAKSSGKPDIRGWIVANKPPIWDTDWNKFLPTDSDSDTVRVNRLLLGDRRPGQPEAPPIPEHDQNQSTGIDYQFNAQLFVYLHGNNCSTQIGAYGFPTFFYPLNVLVKQGPDTYPPRADGATLGGTVIPSKDLLDVKSINCITNALLAAFCHWDGGQLATNDVLDFVTDSPSWLGNDPGCGSQSGNENPPASNGATKGGRCADLARINATYDAGGHLPEPGSPLNFSNYMYPFFAETVTHDKAWEISAPGRGSLAADGEPIDTVRIQPGDEPWMDLAGNLNEAVLTMNGATFSGKFGLKYRGIGYQSARSELNVTTWDGEDGLRRLERAEARAGYQGGRCMRFK